jgi:hypothetical protein
MLYNRLFTLLFGAFFPVFLTAQGSTIVDVSGVISQPTTWTADKTYRLVGYVYVKNGATLTIQPGTVIKGDKPSKGTLIITRGSKIMAQGTRQQPIVFTSEQATPAPGDWGGVVICGFAPTNTTTSGISCLGVAEGNINTTSGDALYGGGDQGSGCGGYDNDNSGVLRFVRIEYAGTVAQMNREVNGLTLAGVGRGTTIEYVQVSHSLDDGFEWFGGTVDCKYLVSYGNRDDDFDCDLGYSGRIQFALAIRNDDLADVSGSHGIEIDNDEVGTPATPKTKPTFSNVTIVGPNEVPSVNYRRAAIFRRNSEPALFNSILMGEFPIGLNIDGVGAVANAQNDLLKVQNCYVADAQEPLKTSETAFNINQWFETSTWNNDVMPSSQTFGLADPFNYADPNAQPTGNSILLNSAKFNDPRLQEGFFQSVSYMGALANGQDWTCGWAKFAALNTNCVSSTGQVSALEEIQLTPTLVTSQALLTLKCPDPTDHLLIQTFDLEGRSVGTDQVIHRLDAGTHTFEISVSTLPSGLYWVRLQTERGFHVEKMMVVR